MLAQPVDVAAQLPLDPVGGAVERDLRVAARFDAFSTTPCVTGATMSQVKSLFGPRPKVTLAATAREKYFSVISSMRALACSRSDSPVST